MCKIECPFRDLIKDCVYMDKDGTCDQIHINARNSDAECRNAIEDCYENNMV